MSYLKNAIRTLLSRLGYQITKIDDAYVRFGGFRNLAKAYEAQMDISLPENDSRYPLLAKLQGTPPTEAYSILEAISRTRDLDGDVCEFGVAEGETSALIANEIAKSKKSLYLFDSFEGLPKPTEKDELIDDIFSLGSMDAYEGKMSFPEQSVRARLKAISFPESRTIIHKGFVDKVLERNNDLPARVSVAYVDFDFYEPIMQALGFLEKVLSKGGFIIVDDYGFFSSGAKNAVDEWLESVNENDVRYTVRSDAPESVGYIVVERVN